jgi:hypothetical protein
MLQRRAGRDVTVTAPNAVLTTIAEHFGVSSNSQGHAPVIGGLVPRAVHSEQWVNLT